MRLHTFLFLGIMLGSTPSDSLNAQPAQPATSQAAVEQTPRTLPGADTFVYRDMRPESMRLHVFKPDGWKRDDRRAALVFFFGGGFNRGTPERSAGWAKWGASLGMVGVAPDYRTRDRFGTTGVECVADARAAVRWVQDHADELGVDPNRIIVGGSSAGGHLALWTAIERTPPGSDPSEAPKSKPAALVLLSAPSDTFNSNRAARFGTHAEALSPLQQLDPKMPPVLAFHGDADTTVVYSDTVRLHEKLRAAGSACEFVTVPGGTHNFLGELPEWRERTRAMIERFLREHHVLPPAANGR